MLDDPTARVETEAAEVLGHGKLLPSRGGSNRVFPAMFLQDPPAVSMGTSVVTSHRHGLSLWGDRSLIYEQERWRVQQEEGAGGNEDY